MKDGTAALSLHQSDKYMVSDCENTISKIRNQQCLYLFFPVICNGVLHKSLPHTQQIAGYHKENRQLIGRKPGIHRISKSSDVSKHHHADSPAFGCIQITKPFCDRRRSYGIHIFFLSFHTKTGRSRSLRLISLTYDIVISSFTVIIVSIWKVVISHFSILFFFPEITLHVLFDTINQIVTFHIAFSK